MRIALGIVIITGILVGCAPNELPENVIAEPIFYAEGTLDGAPFSLLAGPENVEVVSSSYLTEDELIGFNILFSQAGCSNCERLSIDLIGSTAADMTQIEQLLPAGEYQPFGESDEQFSGYYTADFGNNSATSIQFFSVPGGELVFVAADEPFQAQPGAYQIAYTTVDGLNACFSTVAGSLELGTSGEVSFSQVLSGTDQFGDYIDLAAFENGTVIISSSSDESDVAQIEIVGQKIYTSELPFFPEDIFTITVNSDNEEQSYSAEYSFSNGFSIDCIPFLNIEPIAESVPALPLSALVSYMNNDGETYSIPSGTDDFFIVQSIEPYLNDPLGREAYSLNFTCGLVLAPSTSGVSALQLEITDGIIPIVIE